MQDSQGLHANCITRRIRIRVKRSRDSHRANVVGIANSDPSLQAPPDTAPRLNGYVQGPATVLRDRPSITASDGACRPGPVCRSSSGRGSVRSVAVALIPPSRLGQSDPRWDPTAPRSRGSSHGRKPSRARLHPSAPSVQTRWPDPSFTRLSFIGVSIRAHPYFIHPF